MEVAMLQNYESLATLMGLMNEAASHGQWNRLVDLEQQCRKRMDIIRQVDQQQSGSISEDVRKRKAALIRKILADDAAIRRHTEPWLEQLQGFLVRTRRDQQLKRAYAST